MDTSTRWLLPVNGSSEISKSHRSRRYDCVEHCISSSHLVHPDIKPSNLYVDAVSLPMINGSVIDFATELIGSSFRIVDNPQAKGGCGCGVSWEMKE